MQYNKKCACCGNSLSPELKFFDICKVCGWQDDPIQNDDPDYDGGANYISLNEAKQAFAEGKQLGPIIKAVKQRWKKQQAEETALRKDETETTVAVRELAPEQLAEIKAADLRPSRYTKDCPELTDEQLAEFQPVTA